MRCFEGVLRLLWFSSVRVGSVHVWLEVFEIGLGGYGWDGMDETVWIAFDAGASCVVYIPCIYITFVDGN